MHLLPSVQLGSVGGKCRDRYLVLKINPTIQRVSYFVQLLLQSSRPSSSLPIGPLYPSSLLVLPTQNTHTQFHHSPTNKAILASLFLMSHASANICKILQSPLTLPPSNGHQVASPAPSPYFSLIASEMDDCHLLVSFPSFHQSLSQPISSGFQVNFYRIKL